MLSKTRERHNLSECFSFLAHAVTPYLHLFPKFINYPEDKRAKEG